MMGSMWVRVWEWVLVEGERPTPKAGSLLHAVGVRVRGVVTGAESAQPDGVVEVVDHASSDPRRTFYGVTATASDAQDVWTNTKRWGQGEHFGAEFVLTVGPDRFQVQFDGPASDVMPGSRVTAIGYLELVGEYEWDAFELTDTRADWHVIRVVELPSGDIAVELTHPLAV